MARECQHDKTQRGLSLVELMVAMVAGLLLMGGVVQVYSSSKQAYRLGDNLSRMQENARFAMDMLARDIRMAGFLPCKQGSNFANTIRPGFAYGNLFTNGLRGYEGADGKGEFPADLSDAATGTDALVILKGGGAVHSIEKHTGNGNSSTIFVKGTHDIESGDIVLVCNDKQATIFQANNGSATSGQIVHDPGKNDSPGNCTKDMFSTGEAQCTSASSGTNFVTQEYGQDAQLVKYDPAAYYIAPSVSGTTRSLYRRRLSSSVSSGGGPQTASTTFRAEELLEGIENMQILYGLDSDDDARANQFLTADQVDAAAPLGWTDVVSVRVGLLVQTPEEVAAAVDSNAYTVAGTVIDDAGSAVLHAADRRQRYVFASTIKIRNRGLQ